MGLESLTTLRLYRNFNLSGECASKREREQRLLLALFESCPVFGRLDTRNDSNTRQSVQGCHARKAAPCVV